MTYRSGTSRNQKPRGLRWWPALVIGILFAGFCIWTWALTGQTRQDNVMATIFAGVVTFLLLVLWFLLASRAPWRWRVASLAVVVIGGFAASKFVTIRGVSGDLVPILGWKGGSEVVRGDVVTVTRQAGQADARPASALSYPQFLGPNRNATVAGPALARDWDASPPEEIWRREVGPAWSAFAIAGDWAITQEQGGENEEVAAYDLWTGEERWRHRDETRYDTTIGGIGPRATPTIADGVVYTLGANGLLNALVVETGKRLWARNVLEENGAANREWGKSCSPLVVGELVVVSAGGRGKSLVAYDRTTGELVWAAGDDTASYSSPILATVAGREQIVIRNQHSFSGHDPETGEVLWSETWSAEFPNVAVPLVLGNDRLLISTGYGIGSKLFQMTNGSGGFEMEEVWASPRLKAKFTNVVEHEGYVYGLDDGVMVCLDPQTGERYWKKGRYGHGQVILVGDLLLVTSEKGDVHLLDPNPKELRELGKFTAFGGKTWNPPALVGQYLLVRSDKEAALYKLPVAG